MHILSTYQSPETILLMVIIDFKPGLDTHDITKAIERIRDAIKKEFTLIRFVLIQPDTYRDEK
jgi:divalent metal cation (Fe/Co/Zn/Cd) transporter